MKAIVNAKLVFPDTIIDGTLLMDDGRIVAAGDVFVPQGAQIIDAKGLYVGPGLIDQHLHGYSSCSERINVIDDARAVADRHLRHGTTTVTPSASYNISFEDFMSIIRQCNAAIEEGNTTIAGIHFEGPFTNPARGASARLTWEFSDEVCERIFSAGKGNVLHCTYAPEMPHGEKMEAVLKKYGVIADIGHTNADPASIDRAVKNDAKIVTHLFDAMGCYLDDPTVTTGSPQDCVAEIVLSIPQLYHELICDSRCIHVTAASQRLALRAAGEDHIILISDCTAAQNVVDPADYPPEDKMSARDLNFNLEGELSGSRLTLAQSAANFKKVTGADIRVVFKCASTNSAKALGLYDRVGSIHAGKEANLVFVDDDFTVKAVYFQGEAVADVR